MLSIDPDEATPPYEQLRQQLIHQITTGELPPGSKLAPVRRLAVDLNLAPNTVARAYRTLEEQGFVRTAGRNGTVVAGRTLTPDLARRADELTANFLHSMAELGFTPDEISSQVSRALTVR